MTIEEKTLPIKCPNPDCGTTFRITLHVLEKRRIDCPTCRKTFMLDDQQVRNTKSTLSSMPYLYWGVECECRALIPICPVRFDDNQQLIVPKWPMYQLLSCKRCGQSDNYEYDKVIQVQLQKKVPPQDLPQFYREGLNDQSE
jgi:hypothetical protein